MKSKLKYFLIVPLIVSAILLGLTLHNQPKQTTYNGIIGYHACFVGGFIPAQSLVPPNAPANYVNDGGLCLGDAVYGNITNSGPSIRNKVIIYSATAGISIVLYCVLTLIARIKTKK